MAEGVIWELKEGTAPPSAPGYKTMLSETLNCTPREFFAAFLSDRSTFWKDVLVERGDKGVKFDSWSSHSKLGTVRSVYFVSPVKAPIGPPETRCHQSQRYNVYENDHLVLETSQVMNDIPYGDYFSVDMRWDVTAASRTTSLVELRINIPFTRKTMLKGKIEKTTAGETSACFAAWMSKAKEHLEIGASQQSEGSGKCVKRGRRKRSSDSASMASHDARDVREHEDAAACSTIRYPGDYASEAAVAPETLTTSVTSWVSSAAPSMQVWMGIAIIVLMLLNTYLFLAPRRSCTCQVGPTAMNGMMQENMLMMQQQILDTQQQLAHVMRGLSETAGRMAAASYDVRSP
uniref:VASt domain-containing protein n=1 Tax=Tetraselmis chuii TaxID=63592 RepID=A0A7S1SIG4_9CHLO